MSNKVLQEDIQSIATSDMVPWEAFAGKTVAVTGVTGLIGRQIALALLERSKMGDNIKVLALARNLEKAEHMLGTSQALEFVAWDAASNVVPSQPVDVIIHAAAPTASKFFVEKPLETIDSIVAGTRAMLEWARAIGARLCYLSSMEVYGEGSNEPLTEDMGGALDAMNVRSSYPQGKQLAETLCASYASEYDVEVCVARLAQTFGVGVDPADNRVFAQFARACMKGEDIVLLTDGSKKNMYVYTADAVRALLLLAAKGKSGEAYNVANEETFISIREMAENVAAEFGMGKTHVRMEIDEEAAKSFRPGNVMMLDSSKLQSLGWQPQVGLMKMYGRMIDGWKA